MRAIRGENVRQSRYCYTLSAKKIPEAWCTRHHRTISEHDGHEDPIDVEYGFMLPFNSKREEGKMRVIIVRGNMSGKSDYRGMLWALDSTTQA